jgi:hypothetical protein
MIISLRVEVWAHITSLTPPHVIEVDVPSLESDWSCICVLGGIYFERSCICVLGGIDFERSCICVLGGIDFASFYDFDI